MRLGDGRAGHGSDKGDEPQPVDHHVPPELESPAEGVLRAGALTVPEGHHAIAPLGDPLVPDTARQVEAIPIPVREVLEPGETEVPRRVVGTAVDSTGAAGEDDKAG